MSSRVVVRIGTSFTPPGLFSVRGHLGFLAWAILGTLTAIVLAHGQYFRASRCSRARSCIVGERVMKGAFGGVVDAVCVIAVVAGTVGPVNVFLALAIGAIIFLFGPTLFLVNSWLQGMGRYPSRWPRSRQRRRRAGGCSRGQVRREGPSSSPDLVDL